MTQRKIDFDELEWKTPIEGVRERSLVQNNLKMRIVEYGQSMPPHWCEKGHYGLVLEGEMEIEYDTERILYRKGDGVFIPDGNRDRHRARVLTEKALVFFVEGLPENR